VKNETYAVEKIVKIAYDLRSLRSLIVNAAKVYFGGVGGFLHLGTREPYS
jgi:hypothetical protein